MRRGSAEPGSISGRRADVQGLRALAVVLVVAYHAGLPVTGGYVGVDVFFVISGFVVTKVLLEELHRTGTLDLARFYRRRIRRLLPALAAVLAVTCLLSVLLQSPFGQQQDTAQTAIAAALFVANLALAAQSGDYFGDDSGSNPLLHTWSLSVEEQFYVLLPLGLLACWQFGRRALSNPTFAVGGVVAAIATSSFALSVDAVATPAAGSAFFSMPLRAWEFLAGVGVAVLAPRLSAAGGTHARSVQTAGIALIVWSAIVYSEVTAFPGLAAAVPVLGAALVIAGGSTAAGGRGMLTGPAAGFLGDLSYSWYLWHWPLIVYATTWWPTNELAAPAAALVSLPIAIGSYRLLEQPIRLETCLPRMSGIRVAALCIAVPLVVATGLRLGADTGMGLEQPEVAQAARLARSACTDTRAVFPGRECTWTVDDPRGLILLLGDSHATSLSDGVVAAGRRLGYDVAVWAFSQCPFLGLPTIGNSACPSRQAASLRLAVTHADAVVVANRSPWHTRAPGSPDGGAGALVATRDGRTPSDPHDALDAWKSGMRMVLEPLAAERVPVLWVTTVPEHVASLQGSVSVLRPRPRGHELSLPELTRRRSDVMAAEAEVIREYPLARVTDPSPALCTEVCRTVIDGVPMYVDGHHLSPAGSRRVGRALEVDLAGLLSNGSRSRSR